MRRPMSPARAAVTTVVRHAAPGQRSGFLRILDLESGDVLSTTPVPESAFREVDPNPRGGYRGAKGLGVAGGRLVVANSERLFVFDRAWDPQADLTHPLMGSIHDVLAEEQSILVTCTNCDTLLEVDWDGAVAGWWTWRRDPGLARGLGYRTPPPFDPDADYRNPFGTRGRVLSLVQLNAVARAGAVLYVCFGRVVPRRAYLRKRAGALAEQALGVVGLDVPTRLTREPRGVGRLPAPSEPGSLFAIVELRAPSGALGEAEARIAYRLGGVHVPNHSLLVEDDRLLYDDSNGGRLVELDPAAGRELRAAAVPGEPSFARGLAGWRDGHYLVGSQRPTAVHAVDLEAARVVRSYVLGEDPRESVYAVSLVPDDFDDAPATVPFPER